MNNKIFGGCWLGWRLLWNTCITNFSVRSGGKALHKQCSAGWQAWNSFVRGTMTRHYPSWQWTQPLFTHCCRQSNSFFCGRAQVAQSVEQLDLWLNERLGAGLNPGLKGQCGTQHLFTHCCRQFNSFLFICWRGSSGSSVIRALELWLRGWMFEIRIGRSMWDTTIIFSLLQTIQFFPLLLFERGFKGAGWPSG